MLLYNDLSSPDGSEKIEAPNLVLVINEWASISGPGNMVFIPGSREAVIIGRGTGDFHVHSNKDLVQSSHKELVL